MRDDLIEHYPSPYPLDIMPVRKVQQEVQQVLGSFGVDTAPADRVIRISDDGDCEYSRNVAACFAAHRNALAAHDSTGLFRRRIPTGTQTRWTGNVNLKHSRRITGRLRVSPTGI